MRGTSLAYTQTAEHLEGALRPEETLKTPLHPRDYVCGDQPSYPYPLLFETEATSQSCLELLAFSNMVFSVIFPEYSGLVLTIYNSCQVKGRGRHNSFTLSSVLGLSPLKGGGGSISMSMCSGCQAM